jgi:hypothetical protein
MGDYTISDIYQGGYSSLSPAPINYKLNPKTFGMTTDPRTANIVQDASTKLNTGAKHIELSAVGPAEFESIPNQQLVEMKRLSKLTGVSVSVHGPIVEPSGLTQQQFSSSNREAAERQMFSAMERAHLVSPDENISVTFHSSAVPLPGRTSTKGQTPDNALIINKDTGSIHTIPIKERTGPWATSRDKDVKKEIEHLNKQQWAENVRQIGHQSELGAEAINGSLIGNNLAETEKLMGKKPTENGDDPQAVYGRGATYLNSAYLGLQDLFEIAHHNASGVEKNKIENFYKEIGNDAKEILKDEKNPHNAILMKDIVQKGVDFLQKEITAPQLYGDLNDFAKEKTAETISNVALRALKDKNVGNGNVNKTPIINIENPPAGMIFSEGQDLKDIVETSRKKFVERAVSEGMSEGKAEEAAAKLIGVTWDVGHINMLRKYGYEKEDLIKETEKVAPLVKHIHLSDNFGFEHTELPMGMGNVPMKEILDKLGKQGFDAKKIIEAGNWWQHFKTAPFQETLEAFGSPIYSMSMAPYWNQSIGVQQGYYGGYGAMLPQTNYESFGAGFSRLPMELGGQAQGADGSRMSGKKME